MTVKIKEIIEYLDKTFHPEYQEDYDNAGFLLGDGNENYRGALVALDMTPQVLEEALAFGANLIVTHHPLIFSGIKRITDRNATGRLLIRLIQSKVAVYAAHTNLDNLPWGVNGALADRLGLQNRRILRPLPADPKIGAGMVGELTTSMDMDGFLQHVKQTLALPILRHAGGEGLRKIQRIAICGGSGSEFISDALASRADIYLTGDLKYHDFQRATCTMALADIGHYESEQWAKNVIYDTILKKFSNFACRISEKQESLVSYI